TTVIGPEWLPSTADLERLVNEGADKLVVAKQRLAEEFPDLDVTWTLFDGQPAEVLVRASDTAEVLVIGSRGRGGFAGLLLGSTSRSVLPDAQCATVVVRVTRDHGRRERHEDPAEPGVWTAEVHSPPPAGRGRGTVTNAEAADRKESAASVLCVHCCVFGRRPRAESNRRHPL